MPDIFLYAGEPNPNDIRLSDPTVVRGGGAGPTIVEATLTSAGSGAATFSSARKLTTTLSAAGTGAAAFNSATKLTTTLSSAGAGAATFTSARKLTTTLTSTGQSAATWTTGALAGSAFASAGSGLAQWPGENAATPVATSSPPAGGPYWNSPRRRRVPVPAGLDDEEELLAVCLAQYLKD